MAERSSSIMRQLELEREGLELGVERYRKAIGTPNSIPEAYLIRKNVKPLCDHIKTKVRAKFRRGHAVWSVIREYLMEMPTDEVAFITLRHVFHTAAVREKAPLQLTAMNLSKELMQHLDFTRMRKEHPKWMAKVEQNLKTSHQGHIKKVLQHSMNKLNIQKTEATPTQLLNLGLFCLYAVVEATGLCQITRVKKCNKVYRTLQIQPKFLSWINDMHKQLELLSPVFMPMVCPPLPWGDNEGGGYLTRLKAYDYPLIKSRRQEHKELYRQHTMPDVYRALNRLQETRWGINKKILLLMEVCKDTGLGGLPTKPLEDELPPKFWSSDAEFKQLCKTQPERIQQWKQERHEVYDNWNRGTSKRLTLLMQLWIANKFKDDTIYFTYQLDTRGRIYPVQSFLHPQCDKIGKALLQFADGKPLGKEGLRWLMVHGANCFGVDKVSFDDRVAWVKEHHNEIIDSARNPLDGTRFWTEADEPWMFMAFCLEYADAMENPAKIEEFVSYLPIGMDGSCSGLQHFSAMLYDEVGGKSVNLIPGPKPADIYQDVAEVCSEIVNNDFESKEARAWKDKIDRGITKRNVMTFPYGATQYGFTEQLIAELEKRDEKARQKGGDNGYLSEDNFECARYLAKKNAQAISMTVVKAVEAMEWLQAVADIVIENDGKLSWTTPSGFKVLQLYMKQRSKRVNTFVGGTRYQLSLSEDTPKPNPRSHRNAISPNFVHSMDAAHLCLTVNRCTKEAGIKHFAMIHDSFGCHAGDIPELNRIIRETFVEMYSDDVLRNWLDEVKKTVPAGVEFPEPPKPGKLDLALVLDSPYFFA